jgi:hypothetical protein
VAGVVVVTSSAIVWGVVVAQGVGAEMADDGVAALLVNATDEMTGDGVAALLVNATDEMTGDGVAALLANETDDGVVLALLVNATDEMTGRQRLAVMAMTCPMIHNLRRRTQTLNPNQP